MYSRQVQQTLLQTKHNLKTVIFDQKIHQSNLLKYAILMRNIKQWKFLNKNFIKNLILSMPQNLKNESSNLLRVWTHQCECVVAQRVRRSQQMFSLYTKLWEEQALKNFIKNLKLQVTKRSKDVLFGAVGIGAYNWDKNRISESELRSHLEEIEYIKILRRKTMDCKICNNIPDKIDKSILAFCDCDKRKDPTTFENWALFIEQPELIVWRRLHKSGSYEYKVYGTYKDVSAEDFLSVQIDTAYRKKWDPTAVSLDVIERDPTPNSNSDLVYWEMQWPRLFANRDYVFNRRFLVDRAKKTVMLLSKGTVHPGFPAKPNKYRVSDYWSSMVIKPYKEINQPGIEFSLTYFDNPGVNIPAAVTSWVAYRALPDFLTRLRAATLKYKQYCIDHKCNSIYSYTDEPKKTTNEMQPNFKFEEENFFDLVKNMINEHANHNLSLKKIMEHFPPIEEILPKQDDNNNKKESEQPITPASSAPGSEVILTPSPIVQDQSHWKYLHPTYYLS